MLRPNVSGRRGEVKEGVSGKEGGEGREGGM